MDPTLLDELQDSLLRVGPDPSKENTHISSILVLVGDGESKEQRGEEGRGGDDLGVEVADNSIVIHRMRDALREDEVLEFNSVFTDENRDANVPVLAAELVNTLLSGTSVFIYGLGESGTGKTHLLLGPESTQTSLPNSLLNKALIYLYSTILSEARTVDVHVFLSAYEIYNDTIIDLLDPTYTELPPSTTSLMNVEAPSLLAARNLLSIAKCHSCNWEEIYQDNPKPPAPTSNISTTIVTLTIVTPTASVHLTLADIPGFPGNEETLEEVKASIGLLDSVGGIARMSLDDIQKCRPLCDACPALATQLVYNLLSAKTVLITNVHRRMSESGITLASVASALTDIAVSISKVSPFSLEKSLPSSQLLSKSQMEVPYWYDVAVAGVNVSEEGRNRGNGGNDADNNEETKNENKDEEQEKEEKEKKDKSKDEIIINSNISRPPNNITSPDKDETHREIKGNQFKEERSTLDNGVAEEEYLQALAQLRDSDAMRIRLEEKYDRMMLRVEEKKATVDLEHTNSQQLISEMKQAMKVCELPVSEIVSDVNLSSKRQLSQKSSRSMRDSMSVGQQGSNRVLTNLTTRSFRSKAPGGGDPLPDRHDLGCVFRSRERRLSALKKSLIEQQTKNDEYRAKILDSGRDPNTGEELGNQLGVVLRDLDRALGYANTILEGNTGRLQQGYRAIGKVENKAEASLQHLKKVEDDVASGHIELASIEQELNNHREQTADRITRADALKEEVGVFHAAYKSLAEELDPLKYIALNGSRLARVPDACDAEYEFANTIEKLDGALRKTKRIIASDPGITKAVVVGYNEVLERLASIKELDEKRKHNGSKREKVLLLNTEASFNAAKTFNVLKTAIGELLDGIGQAFDGAV